MWVKSCRLGGKNTTQKMKFFMKDFLRKYDQIHRFLWIWSLLLKKSFMKNFIFCAVKNSPRPRHKPNFQGKSLVHMRWKLPRLTKISTSADQKSRAAGKYFFKWMYFPDWMRYQKEDVTKISWCLWISNL